jgi:uncharacterized protein
MREGVHPVTFENRQGLALFGLLHQPAVSRTDVGIILLSPGVKGRVAPHRLYNKMASAFCELGFPVLRFDFHGLGDSEGVVTEAMLADFYRTVQFGRYVEDTHRAIEWMQENCGCDRFVLGGLCGGAITGVLAGAGHEKVAGILGLGLPVILDGSDVDKTLHMTVGQLNGLRVRYFRKLLRPAAWLRLLTFRTDIRLLFRSMLAPFRKRAVTAGARDDSLAKQALASNQNPCFPPAIMRLLSDSRSVLLIFSGSDRLHWEFEEKFLAFHRRSFEKYSHLAEVRVVKDANHIFTFPEWQQEMLRLSESWLLVNFPEPDARHGGVLRAPLVAPPA